MNTDVEGCDTICLSALSGFEERPTYISFESGKTNFGNTEREIELFIKLGHTASVAEHAYGIYLSHSVILWIAFYEMSGFPVWAQIATLTVGAIGVPALLYVSIEKPLIQVGSHVAKRVLTHAEKSEDHRRIALK
jgi:hypothetical protein